MTTTQEDGAAASTSADPHGADAEPPPDACSPAQAQSPPRPGDAPGTDFAEWYAREFGRLRATLALATGDVGLAEEATAEAFARALVNWPRLSRGGAPNGWVYTVAVNQVRSRLRRLATERRYLARQRAGHVAAPPEPDPALWAAVARLGPRARTAVALRYVADLSVPGTDDPFPRSTR